MKNRATSNTGWQSPGSDPQDDTPDLLDDRQLFGRWIEDREADERDSDSDSDSDFDGDDDTAKVPVITSLPEGMEVVESAIGRAIAQWVLLVRCECGRRWFELETIDQATCPRCGLLCYVDVKEGKPR